MDELMWISILYSSDDPVVIKEVGLYYTTTNTINLMAKSGVYIYCWFMINMHCPFLNKLKIEFDKTAFILSCIIQKPI